MKKKKLLIILMIAGMVLCLSACANSCGNTEPEPSAAPESPAPTAAAEPTSTPEPTAESEPAAEPEPETKPESEPAAKPETAAEPEPEAKAESEPAVEPEPEATAESETTAEPEPKATAESEPATEPEPEAKAESEPAAEPEPEAKAESEPAAEPEPETEPESEPVAEPEPKPVPEPEPVSALSPEEQAYRDAEKLLYVDGDYDAAFQLLQDWTDTEYAPLQALIGECYRHGYGTEVDDRLAYDYYRRAAKQNDPVGLFGVATAIRSGYGVPRNQEYGTALLWQAMDASLAAAEASEDPLEQGRLYYQVGYPKMFYMTNTRSHHQDAFELLEKSAECGYPPAEYHVGRLYKGTETYTWYGLPIQYLPEKDEALGDSYLELAQQHGLDITAKITDR